MELSAKDELLAERRGSRRWRARFAQGKLNAELQKKVLALRERLTVEKSCDW